MDEISKIDKFCSDYHDGNRFCFRFKVKKHKLFDPSVPSKSKLQFNKQKRHVPEKPSDVLEPDAVRKDCDFYCDELGGLKAVETSSTLIPGVDKVTNSIVSYSDLDDMCDGCKA